MPTFFLKSQQATGGLGLLVWYTDAQGAFDPRL